MCNTTQIPKDYKYKERLKEIECALNKCEMTALKIKAINFINMQSFDDVYKTYKVGEVYKIDGVGYTVITYKSKKRINFVVIMHVDNIWNIHWQDVDKHIEVKQGVYLDLLTGKEYKEERFSVKAFEPSYFKAIGKDDLILKAYIKKNN